MTFEPGSIAEGLFGAGAVTNSWHHQAVDRCGTGLVVTGRTADGVVEAVELPGSAGARCPVASRVDGARRSGAELGRRRGQPADLTHGRLSAATERWRPTFTFGSERYHSTLTQDTSERRVSSGEAVFGAWAGAAGAAASPRLAAIQASSTPRVSSICRSAAGGVGEHQPVERESVRQCGHDVRQCVDGSGSTVRPAAVAAASRIARMVANASLYTISACWPS